MVYLTDNRTTPGCSTLLNSGLWQYHLEMSHVQCPTGFVQPTSDLSNFSGLKVQEPWYRVSLKKGNKDFKMCYAISFILMSSQGRYLSPLKIEISPVVLHIISFHSS